MEELDDVIGRLTAAAMQLAPSDDQIIADHVRGSVAMLLKVRHKLRERAADLRSRIDSRLNDHLCEMKEGCDDSIVGFNEAWDVMRKCFDDTKVLL